MDAIRLKKLETRMVENEDESWMHPINPGCIQDESISGWMHPKLNMILHLESIEMFFLLEIELLVIRNWFDLSSKQLIWREIHSPSE